MHMLSVFFFFFYCFNNTFKNSENAAYFFPQFKPGAFSQNSWKRPWEWICIYAADIINRQNVWDKKNTLVRNGNVSLLSFQTGSKLQVLEVHVDVSTSPHVKTKYRLYAQTGEAQNKKVGQGSR